MHVMGGGILYYYKSLIFFLSLQEKSKGNMDAFSILLYYCYAPVPDPEALATKTHQFCIDHGLLGRIIIAKEGINGTVSGPNAQCQKFMHWVQSEPGFESVDFKVESTQTHAFKKLYVRVKEEIVNSDLGVNPLERTGVHLEPADFKAIKDDPDTVIVDMRSNYEHSVGKFKNAITFDMENLRELPDHIEEIAHLKHKKIVTYCTGGIKCEKASAYLLSQGFENVYQLHGGIIKYGLEEGGEDFEGKCYVFDGRITTEVNRVNPKVISSCYICYEPCDRMVNCANPECNEHVPICETCAIEMEGACCTACKNAPNKRPYNGTGYYVRDSNGYTPLMGFKSKKRNEKQES
jgi:UPF0176 protein